MTTTPGENVTIEARLVVLETQVEAVQEGQRQIIARLDTMQNGYDSRLDAMQQSMDTRFDSVNARFDALNSRFDRLFYTMWGLGLAAIGTMIALEKVF